jgi:hypothetical protein
VKVVIIKTEDFEARALHFQEMPAVMLLEMMDETLSDGRRVAVMLDVIRKSLLDPSKIVEFNALSMNAMQEVLNQYVKAAPTELEWSE